MAVWLNEATKLVFSRTLNDVTWRNSRLLGDIDPAAIEAMKHEPGGDMMIFGSGSIASQLTEHGLIDEYRFVINPVLLGRGQSLLRDVPNSAKLKLVEARPYASGNVMLRYERA
jgi:dihydrofolate reductase